MIPGGMTNPVITWKEVIFRHYVHSHIVFLGLEEIPVHSQDRANGLI